MTLLALRDVSKSFGALKVTDGITLEVQEGETLGILGPNGAGKTTLFNLISGDVRADAGQVQYDGIDITGLPPHRRCRAGIGRSYQVPQPFGNMSVFENLVTAWLKLGRQPKYNDLNDKGVSFYSPGTYENRFGTWRGALAEFVDWANSGVLPNATAEKEKAPSALRGSRNINWRLRAIVLMRDGARCQLCGAEARDGAKLHIDHIRPWSKGGETVLSNLRVLCAQCNIGKSDVEMGDVSL